MPQENLLFISCWLLFARSLFIFTFEWHSIYADQIFGLFKFETFSRSGIKVISFGNNVDHSSYTSLQIVASQIILQKVGLPLWEIEQLCL
jgi:hypothetical protein